MASVPMATPTTRCSPTPSPPDLPKPDMSDGNVTAFQVRAVRPAADQVGTIQLIKNITSDQSIRNAVTLAKAALAFGMPIVMTSS
jgi:hypothetical protein